MAHAARLNLRMQKELKLLLTDPPPGASFPTLSDQHQGEFSLTTINALLQGPEGTVYSNGVFKIKIQIPERYPFQPPIVTFATPIYHPNIDNGGRICLDILNLPPKGMWQPSLNISTILTSIGLLLSEPNPDDGLMHEASRDYKYNRQAFDQNARSMTEKYAHAGVSDIAIDESGRRNHTSQNISRTEMEGSVTSVASICVFPEQRKLSLGSQGCSINKREASEEISKESIHNSSKNHIEIDSLKEEIGPPKDSSKCTSNSAKLYYGRYKLTPKIPVASHIIKDEDGNISMSNMCSSVLEIQTTSDSPGPSLVQAGNIASIRDEDQLKRSHSISIGKMQSLHRVSTDPYRDSDIRPQKDSLHYSSQNKANPPKDAIARKGYCSSSIRLKKRAVAGVMPSSEPLAYPGNNLTDDKENMAPHRAVFSQLTKQTAASAIKPAVIPESDLFCNEAEKNAVTDPAHKQSETAVKLPVEPLNHRNINNNVMMHTDNLSSRPHLKQLHPENDVTVSKKQNTIEVCDKVAPEAVIVLDSEDSDEDNVPVRSKLCLARRCLSRKRKSGH